MNPLIRLARGGSRARFAPHAAVLGVIALIIGVLTMHAIHHREDGRGDSHAPSVDSIHSSMLDELETAMDVSGGSWTFEDGETSWSRHIAETYSPESCVDPTDYRETSQRQFSIALLGPPQPEFRQAVRDVSRHWKSRGYSLEEFGSETPQVTARRPDGLQLEYSASATRSSLTATTACFPN